MPATVQSNSVLWLGDFDEERAGAQSELIVTFARPSNDATFGVDVMAGRNKAGEWAISRLNRLVRPGNGLLQVQ
jgi:hypothetical protein